MRLYYSLFFLLPLFLVAQPATNAQKPAPAAQSLVPQAAYPSYPEYIKIMEGLAERYPDRCELEVWGTLPSGRQILTLRMTEQVQYAKARPQVLCSATMHGDETAGYWLLLKLAERKSARRHPW